MDNSIGEDPNIPLLSSAEAEQIYGFPAETFAEWCRAGVFAGAYKDDSKWRIPKVAIEEYLKRTPALGPSLPAPAVTPPPSTQSRSYWSRVKQISSTAWAIIGGLAVILSILTAIPGAFIDLPGARDLLFPPSATSVPTPTPLAFATAAPNQTLILIAQFHSTTATDSEPETKIRRRIEGELNQLGETDTYVDVEPTILVADAREQAEALGEQYNASMVIWGEDTGVEVVVNYLNLRQPDFAAAEEKIVERERTQLANPEAYARFIVEDLPGHLTFLALFAVGQTYYVNENYPQAIKVLERAVASAPSQMDPLAWAEAYFRLGWLYEPRYKGPEFEDWEKAILSYDQAIRLNPNYAEAYNNRGYSYVQQRKLEQAIQDFDKAIALDPDNAIAYMNRGIVYYEQGRWEEAIRDYDQAIRLNPNEPIAYVNRGVVYTGQGQWEEAIQDYDRVIQFDPNNAWAYYNRALAYTKQGQLEEAIQDYDRAIQIDPNSAVSYYALCWTYALMSQPQAALPHCNRALELDSQPLFLDARGLVYALLGDFSAASADIQSYIDVLENSPNLGSSAYLEKCKAWLAALKVGINPFTPEVLAELQKE